MSKKKQNKTLNYNPLPTTEVCMSVTAPLTLLLYFCKLCLTVSLVCSTSIFKTAVTKNE